VSTGPSGRVIVCHVDEVALAGVYRAPGQWFRLKLIDEYTIKHQYDKPDGRLVSCEFTLSDWLFRAIKAQKVLTLHPAYFRLRPVAQRHRTGRQ